MRKHTAPSKVFGLKISKSHFSSLIRRKISKGGVSNQTYAHSYPSLS